MVALLLGGGACSRGADRAVSAAGDPAFDERWNDLSASGQEVMFVGDDRGEALMGNVRKAAKASPPDVAPVKLASPTKPPTETGVLDGEEVARVIRGNLVGVKTCYLRMARRGVQRSGKAILSFSIGADGKASNVRVDAPAFRDTPLPACMRTQVSFWAFPKSAKGGGPVSYPFVFAGA